MVRVDRADDERVAGYRHLMDGERRARVERDAGVFVVEGWRTIAGMLADRWPVRSVLLSERRAEAHPELVAAAGSAGTEVLVGGQELFDRIAGYPVHRGALALAARPPERAPGEILAGTATALVVEGVNDFENVGALFRNAAALGAGAVLLDPSTADPLYRRCVRVSLGHVMRVPFARLAGWPRDLAVLKEQGFAIMALSPGGPDEVTEVAAACHGRIAVMVGAEGPGLSPAALAAADTVARIRMAPGVDSLNVATAAAIALHSLPPRD